MRAPVLYQRDRSLRRLAAPMVVALLSVLGSVGCADNHEPASPPVSVAWREVRPPGGAPVVQDLAACDGRWYAVGAAAPSHANVDGGRPGAWTSTDTVMWTPIILRPKTQHGALSTFSTVACRGRDVVAIGAVPGGADGNVRVSTWRSQPDGSWAEAPVNADLFGGPNAGSVDRVVAGLTGWLIVGQWRSPTTGLQGAAVWTSTDGISFRRVDDDPSLRSRNGALTKANDAALAPWNGWVLVGEVSTAGKPEPAAWTSADGLSWRRITVDMDSGTGVVERVVSYHHEGLLAIGTDGAAFHGWLADPVPNKRLYNVRAAPASGPGPATVAAVAKATTAEWPTAAFAALDDGAKQVLSATVDGVAWHEIAAPAPLPSRSGGWVRLAGDGGRLLLLVSAREGGVRLWVADVQNTKFPRP